MMFIYGFAYSIIILIVDSQPVSTVNRNLHSAVQN